MNRSASGLTLLAALSVGTGLRLQTAPQTPRITYTFALEHDSTGVAVVEVSAMFPATDDTVARIVHPSSWAGETDLQNSIRAVQFSPPAHIVSDSGGVYTVRLPRRGAVNVRFTIRQDWEGPIRYPQYHRPIVSDSFVVFNTQNGLLFPEGPRDRPVEVDVAWRGFPRDLSVVTSLGAGRDVRRTLLASELVDASFAAGRFRQVRRGALSVAVAGNWRFADTTFAEVIARVYGAERSFWRDTRPRPYFVILLPTARRGLVAGTAFTHGFISIADTASRVELVGLNVAHELFHEWNGGELRTTEPEGPDKWFSEGVTDYYADRMARVARILRDSAYVDRVNSSIRRYYLSPLHGADRATVATAYWQRAEAKEYAYTQGYTFALFMDHELRVLTNGASGFDDAMRAIHAAAVASRKPYSDSLLIASMPRVARARVQAVIDSMIGRGADIPVLPGSIAGCDSVATARLARFELGFDATSLSRGKTIAGVDLNGPAARAGVRDGMVLLDWTWNTGRSTTPVKLTLADSSVITYLPEAQQKIDVPRITGCSTLK